jgi:PiT family inorganic phosphate transporter
MVGAVLGVGMARGISSLNMDVVRGIFMSWVITLPIGGVLAIVFFYILKGFFG